MKVKIFSNAWWVSDLHLKGLGRGFSVLELGEMCIHQVCLDKWRVVE